MKRPEAISLAVTLAALVCAATAHAAVFTTVVEKTLPAALVQAMDVRWDGDKAVVLATGKGGVYRFPLGEHAPPQAVVPGGKPPTGFFFSSIVAVDSQRTV